MKIFVIVMGVLAVTTAVYGLNMERLQTYYTNLKKCSEEIGATFEERKPEALVCAAERDSKLLNEKGEFMRDAALTGLEDAISDPSKLKHSKDTYNKCHDEAEASKVTGHDQALQILTCFKPYVGLFDKL